MTYNSSQNQESYVPVYDTVPQEWNDGREFLVEHLKKVSNGLNIREIGWFLDTETITGQQFIPSTQNISGASDQYRTILRKVINFGALPVAGTKSVAHGITVDANFTLMNMYISATDPIALAGFSLQYSSLRATDSIRLFYDSMHVNVITTDNYSNFSRSYVVMEYIQEL